jgi:hypothetical protein
MLAALDRDKVVEGGAALPDPVTGRDGGWT